jgi:SAM-dependent methyltransferase
MSEALNEIGKGDRFAFGENWARFLSALDDSRIEEATNSLKEMLSVDDLAGQRFVDVGSGSGLFSLAARKLDGEVVSLDYDPRSVACTAELRRRYYPGDAHWQVVEGSALDRSFLASLGQFDVVYSWGVLHHTGDMWSALSNVAGLVKPVGRLFVSIYNDQGLQSRVWKRIKQRYNSSGSFGRSLLLNGVNAYFAFSEHRVLRRVYRRMRGLPAPPPTSRGRGMDRRVDMIDWVGGYPFEVATPESIFDFYQARDFALEQLKTKGGGIGCNEFVFRRSA